MPVLPVLKKLRQKDAWGSSANQLMQNLGTPGLVTLSQKSRKTVTNEDTQIWLLASDVHMQIHVHPRVHTHTPHTYLHVWEHTQIVEMFVKMNVVFGFKKLLKSIIIEWIG